MSMLVPFHAWPILLSVALESITYLAVRARQTGSSNGLVEWARRATNLRYYEIAMVTSSHNGPAEDVHDPVGRCATLGGAL